MQNHFRKINKLLFLLTTLFMVSCSKDAYDELISKENNTMKMVLLDSKTIKKEKGLFSKITKLNKNLSRLNTEERNVSSSVYNFSIDTDYCKMITFDSITSYTFNVTREPNNGEFENLAIKRLPNGEFITKLFKYNVTPEEKHNILHGIDVDMTGKIVVTDINDTEFTDNIFGKAYFSELCFQAEFVWSPATPCKGTEHHAYGDTTCPYYGISDYMQAQPSTSSVVYVPIDCPGGGGTYYGPNGQPYPDYPPGVLDTGVITSPVPTISLEESMFKLFKKDLTDAQYDWLIDEQNENTEASILSYLTLNDFDVTSINFIIDVINLSIDLDINAMDVWNDYELFRAQMSNDERNIFDNMLINRRLMYIVAAKKAFDKANELYPNSTHNGKGDAFRHALWNGLASLLIGQNLAEQLTTAHETKPSEYTFNYKEKEMDLFNNNKGRSIATFSDLFNIVDNVTNYLVNGYLRYLNNLDNNSFATYNSTLIPTNQ